MTTLSETRLKVYTQPDLSVKAAFCTRAVLNCSALTKADQSVWKKNKEKASESALRVISKPLPGEVTPRAPRRPNKVARRADLLSGLSRDRPTMITGHIGWYDTAGDWHMCHTIRRLSY